jgi:2'-5' RNA ligase
MSKSIRAFIAVEIPDDVKQEVTRITEGFMRLSEPIRWVNRQNLHLTLVFLGENPLDFIDRVKEQLTAVSEQFTRFELSLKNLGAFPNERAPRVIWVGIEDGARELCELARNTQQSLVSIGFIPEKRPFSAHLTLGRVKGPVRDIKPILSRSLASRRFPVERIVLFRSYLQPTGPTYERLAEFVLRGS